MPKRRAFLVMMDRTLLDGLKRLRERDGVSAAEVIRRATKAWLEQKGVLAPRKGIKRGGAR